MGLDGVIPDEIDYENLKKKDDDTTSEEDLNEENCNEILVDKLLDGESDFQLYIAIVLE